jgi:hypothetical protein
MNERLINVKDDLIKPLLSLLLKDKTTGENIIWATDTHPVFMNEKDILLHSETIRPRVEKSLDEQAARTKKKAEVFTPTWVCNRMNDNIDKTAKRKTWKEYVDLRVLEITCGEAPFLVQRYDTVTGKPISLKDRAGLLDRKLKVVNEKTNTYDEWLKWAIRAFESSYGYEYQGDNLLIARINLLLTFVDYYKDRWEEEPGKRLLRRIANRIVWNVWQMDGLQGTVPFREDRCRIHDWRKRKTIVFIS